MQALERGLVDKLKLEKAVLDEVKTRRNLLPPEPWLHAVEQRSSKVAAWVRTRLLSGVPNSAGVVISARKMGHGIRPVPVVGIAERITYRALASHILKDQTVPTRSPEEYKEFVLGPISYAFEKVGGRRRVKVGESRIGYVVEADITAFYQYIDHEVLRQELYMQTGVINAVDRLMELLSDLSGRNFGVPQLLDASDWLSEMYIRIVERTLLRRGLPTWRFNDDFRIGCKNYREALTSLEELAYAAGDVGLVVGDHKTFTSTFMNYFFANTAVEVDEATAEFDPQDVEIAVTDYADMDEEESIAAAVTTLGRLDAIFNENHIDLKNVRKDDLRDLRRALNALSRNDDAQGVSYIKRLFQFVPALTPQVITYLVRIHPQQPEETSRVWKSLLVESASDWQNLWLVYACREMRILTENSELREWVQAQAHGRRQEALRAEAHLTLARAHAVSFVELDAALRSAPDALAPWYVLGMKELTNSENPPSESQIKGLRQSSPLFSILMEDDEPEA
ncbi:RNA-directed DNA polymerase [Micromonospora aurantiaca (nom. illeg.)]|uniref:RNA-directed DNA polymerase n=1 Tax=Micromonospora aurantiaca (nom. illeg.) TaxID=47850 RepID=UPI003F4A3167